ncbi:Putative NADH-flavin reductase [Rathayibacter oskolensis]|uniref:Putative NADH-flavin reductase n=1 Tax=Rathayibacter oskolensis TaxID=1891671 RepID=A0A1X7NXU7_9MICO|nr:NAD(P)H-binding protein [Rathayibacter oskolensis]SMH42769.1 Putative NADH-flavin reductase [Rathayibacter oskolensis]
MTDTGNDESDGSRRHSRVLILGANGPTGRETTQQALARGYEVHALTRHPETFPLEHERLRIIAGDATDPTVIDAAVAATDAVICTIGASFTRHPVNVYSVSSQLLVAALLRHGRRRLMVVTSSGVQPSHLQHGALQRLSYTVMRRFFGRTVYDDMTAMEAFVSASDLDWTIVRPPGLSNDPGRGYAVAENEIEGGFCSRADLARLLLDQLDDDRFLRKIAAVSTPGLRVSAVQMIKVEVLKR